MARKSDATGGQCRANGRISDTDEFRRNRLIRSIERSVEAMTLPELEALSYDMFTKGYIDEADI